MTTPKVGDYILASWVTTVTAIGQVVRIGPVRPGASRAIGVSSDIKQDIAEVKWLFPLEWVNEQFWQYRIGSELRVLSPEEVTLLMLTEQYKEDPRC